MGRSIKLTAGYLLKLSPETKKHTFNGPTCEVRERGRHVAQQAQQHHVAPHQPLVRVRHGAVGRGGGGPHHLGVAPHACRS